MSGLTPEEKVDVHIAENISKAHEIDSLNLLIFMSLMILVMCTVWFSRHYKLRFIHETGLAMIYGLVVGLIIWGSAKYSVSNKTVVQPINTTHHDAGNPYEIPSRIYLQVCPLKNATHCHQSDISLYQYNFNRLVPESEANKDIGSDQQELQMRISFNPEVFMNFILPPIIFNAGYSIDTRSFFGNIGAIFTLAFLGTIISCIATAGILYPFTLMMPSLSFSFIDCVMFGSMVSATDPVSTLAIFQELGVEARLFALVFGEAILNDAIAFVLTGTVLTYEEASISASTAASTHANALGRAAGNFFAVFFGACAIGISFALVTALLTKYTKLKEFPLLESSIFILASYSSFLAAESCSFSGIVAILFCGMMQAHYTYHNLGGESKKLTRDLFELVNLMMEHFCFVYIGITVFTFKNHNWHVGFIFASLFAVFVSRFINIYPLCWILNRVRHNKIPWKHQHMLVFAALRGAMAFALSIRDTASLQKQTMLSATLVLVMVTVFLGGGMVHPVINMLKIETKAKKSPGFGETRPTPDYDSTTRVTMEMESEEAARRAEERLKDPVIVQKWAKLDKILWRPLFTHLRPALTDTMPNNPFMQRIAMMLTTEEQLSSGGRMNVVTSPFPHSPPSGLPRNATITADIGDDDDDVGNNGGSDMPDVRITDNAPFSTAGIAGFSDPASILPGQVLQPQNKNSATNNNIMDN